MTEHGLSQKDLPEVGAQSMISELLVGKRKHNLHQVKALAQRFQVRLYATHLASRLGRLSLRWFSWFAIEPCS